MALFRVDKEEMGKRLVVLQNQLMIKSSRQFAISIGADPSFFAKAQKGEVALSDKYVEELERIYNVNSEWLIYGKGEMFGLKNPQIDVPELLPRPGPITTTIPGNDYIESRRKLKADPKLNMVPFLSRKVQAGYVKAYDQALYMDTLEKFSLPPSVDPRGAEWMYFEIQGDSMNDTFIDGDIICCSMVPHIDWQEIRNFYVYVVITEDQLLIKRLYRKNDEQWVMISDNEEAHPQKLIDVKDIKQLWVYRYTWHTSAKPPKKFTIKV